MPCVHLGAPVLSCQVSWRRLRGLPVGALIRSSDVVASSGGSGTQRWPCPSQDHSALYRVTAVHCSSLQSRPQRSLPCNGSALFFTAVQTAALFTLLRQCTVLHCSPDRSALYLVTAVHCTSLQSRPQLSLPCNGSALFFTAVQTAALFAL